MPAVLMLASACCFPAAAAASGVYKCIQDGQTGYRSDSAAGSCQRIELQVSQPSPEELARLEAEKQRRREAKAKAAAREREERMLRAKELEAQAAWRRALAEEDQARLMREQEHASQAWGYYYPAWWLLTLNRPPLHLHRRLSGEAPVPRDAQRDRRGGGIRFGFDRRSRAMR